MLNLNGIKERLVFRYLVHGDSLEWYVITKIHFLPKNDSLYQQTAKSTYCDALDQKPPLFIKY